MSQHKSLYATYACVRKSLYPTYACVQERGRESIERERKELERGSKE
jgi:hypothetical protein